MQVGGGIGTSLDRGDFLYLGPGFFFLFWLPVECMDWKRDLGSYLSTWVALAILAYR